MRHKMRHKIKATLLMASALLAGFLLLVGCANTGTERATKTTSSMQKLEDDYRAAASQIEATDSSLQELIRPGQPNMKKANSAYSQNVKKMENIGERIENHTEKMKDRGNQYFTEWESSYTNPEIRELSERRRIEMREGYAKIAEASVGVKGALKAYLTDIREIEKFVSNDLTSEGVDAIKVIAQTAIQDGTNLKEAIKPVLVAIEAVKKEFAQGGANKVTTAPDEGK